MTILETLIEYYARKSSPGQTSFFGEWKESDHPRDDDGKFTSTGGGATMADEPFELTRQKVREGGPDKKRDPKERQGKLLEGMDDKPGQTTIFDDDEPKDPMEKMWDRIKGEKAADEDPPTEEKPKSIGLSPGQQEDFDQLKPILTKQVASEITPRRKALAASGVISGEAPAIQKALAEHLRELSPETHGYIVRNPSAVDLDSRHAFAAAD